MLKKIILLFSLLTKSVLFSQGSNVQFVGEKLEIISIIDSISFKDPLKSSLYYLDSVKRIPYSGLAVAKYGENEIDSFNIENGYKNGLAETYVRRQDTFIICRKELLNQNKLIYLSRKKYPDLKKSSGFIKFFSDDRFFFYDICYKQNGLIILRETTNDYYGKVTKIKKKFKTYSDLETYLKDIPYYLLCKEMNFFDKEIKGTKWH